MAVENNPSSSGLDFVSKPAPDSVQGDVSKAKSNVPEGPYDPTRDRETARGDLARGLLWLLGFTVAGILVFIALGRLDGSVLSQSIFPSLIALAGTALGFYFGTGQPSGSNPPKDDQQK